MLRRWAALVVRWPRTVLATLLLATAMVVPQAAHLRLDIRERDQLPQDHAFIQLYNRINDRFGGGAIAVVGVLARRGDVYDPEVLAAIARITRRIEALPVVERGGSVLSLASPRVKALQRTDDGVDVHVLMPSVPTDAADLHRLRQEVAANDSYVGTLVSADASAAAVVVEVPVDGDHPALHRALEAIVAPERNERTAIVLGGGPVIMAYLNRYTAQMAVLFPLAVLIIALVHYEAFRTAQAMVLPLVTALLSVAWSLGIMGWWRAPLDTWSALAPVAILAVAAGHAVQILKRYYEEYAARGDSGAAVVASLERVGPVMITAGAIAASGFASLATFRIPSVRVFGLLMASGIVSALVIEMTLIPACRVLLPPPRARETARERDSRWLTPLLERLSALVVRRPWLVLIAAAAGVAVIGAGAFDLRVDSSMRGYFAAKTQLRLDDEVINRRFAGASVLKILVEGDADGALTDPAVLRALADLGTFLAGYPEIGKVLSVSDYVRRMHAAMGEHGAAAAAPAIPDSQPLIAQYLFLYSLSGQPDDLSALVDAAHRSGIVLAFSRSDAASFVQRLVREVDAFTAARFRHLPVRVGVAGGSLGAQTALNEVVVRDKIGNMLQVAAIIFLLSSLALRSLTGGLLVLTPLAAAAFVNLGVMGWLGMPLSMSTAAVTAIGVSIGADFAIYLLFRLREELRAADLATAVHRTLMTSGKAIFFVSSAVTLGYLVLVTSGFAAWTHLGGLTALIMVVSSLAALSVLPALILVSTPRFLARSAPR